MFNENTIAQAKQLVENLEAGNEEAAQENLDSLSSVGQHKLFKEIGKLTRELHDTLNSFTLDTKLTSLAAQDMPEAKDRLEYVMKLTADAANRTMDAVEGGIELASSIKEESAKLDLGWQKVRNKELDGNQFRDLCSSTESFISLTANDSVALQGFLQDALMAQDFQDLTGQVITRVIQMVQEVQDSLVATIKMFGEITQYDEAVVAEKKIEKGSTGPTINADERDDVVSNQDDVDDLLSSLGF